MRTAILRRRLAGVLAATSLLATPAAARICDRPAPDVVRAVSPSVVRVLTLTIDPFRPTERVQYRASSGFVFDALGHVVTNAHAVHGVREMMIAVDGAPPFPAELVGLDAITDVAVLRRHPDPSLQPRGRPPTLFAAPLGDSETLAVGETLLAIGYPVGLGQTVTRGILTARDRTLPLGPLSWSVPMLQTDAAISRGNSGGPLVDSCGEVAGMTAVLLPNATDTALAVPAALLREVAGEIIEKGRVVRPWHGLSGQMVPPIFAMFGMPPGFLIETVEPGSPAELAGLRGGRVPLRIGPEDYLMGGDLIVAVDGRRLGFAGGLMEIVRGLRVGQRIRVTYLRDGREMEAEATLPERPSLPGDFGRFDNR